MRIRREGAEGRGSRLTVRINTSKLVGKSQKELRQILASAAASKDGDTIKIDVREAAKVRQEWEARLKTRALPNAEQSVVFNNFLNSIKTVQTLAQYHKGLHRFMQECGISSYEYFATAPAVEIEQHIIDFIAKRVAKSPSITGNGIYNYTKPVRLLLNQNKRKDIDWERIGRVTPQYNNAAHDEAYDIEQVRLAFEFTKLRGKVVIGLMSGSGIRRGGFVGLCFKHLVTSPKLDKYGIYKVRVYADTEFEYHTYTTPETRRLIEMYKEQRIRDGEPVTGDSPVVRDAYDPGNPESVRNPVAASENMITHLILRILQGCGLRVNIPTDPENGIYAGSIRHEIKLDHGFRKFFETTCTDWGLPQPYLRLLQGHKSKGLATNYYRPKDDGYILEGNERLLGYVQMIPYLTINNTAVVAAENQKLKQKMEDLDAYIAEKVKATAKSRVEEVMRRELDAEFKPENMTW